MGKADLVPTSLPKPGEKSQPEACVGCSVGVEALLRGRKLVTDFPAEASG